MSIMGCSSQLVKFYGGSGSDNKGRFLEDIFKWDYARLESVHDYIQWLFPLKERSAFNSNAPLLTPKDVENFIKSDKLKEQVTKAFDLMLGFYGFQRNGLVIKRAGNYADRIHNWLSYGNHNYLRITRILKSLSVLGLRSYAEAFLSALDEVYSENREQIGASYSYWKNATR